MCSKSSICVFLLLIITFFVVCQHWQGLLDLDTEDFNKTKANKSKLGSSQPLLTNITLLPSLCCGQNWQQL